ncbi:MAG TPA: ABC transporter ATP-binding protein [Candidatus Tectomicrobia bacterium]|nr:ABC transporter ATP-binding protein [Candidatus Tectomicrobia bacterium]
MTPVIELQGVHIAFDGHEVLHGIDLSVVKSETLTIMGGSGSGKSVLLRLIAGLIKPDVGEIRIDGTDIVPLNEDQMLGIRQRMGVVFQQAALFDSMSVADNIAYPLREHTTLDEGAIQQRVAELLEIVGLPGIQEKYPAELSGGMRKRVGIARALAMKPAMVLYDEPTSGLDPSNSKMISQLIMRVAETFGTTSIVVSHDLHWSLKISTRVALIYDGKIIAVDTPAEFQSSQIPEVQAFLAGDLYC